MYFHQKIVTKNWFLLINWWKTMIILQFQFSFKYQVNNVAVCQGLSNNFEIFIYEIEILKKNFSLWGELYLMQWSNFKIYFLIWKCYRDSEKSLWKFNLFAKNRSVQDCLNIPLAFKKRPFGKLLVNIRKTSLYV